MRPSFYRDVTGRGYGPLSLGTANIDHVVLSGAQRWLDSGKAGAFLADELRAMGMM